MIDKQVEIIDKIELSSCIVSLRDDGIFQVNMKVLNREMEEKDVREMTEIIGEMGKGKTYPVLILIEEFNPIQKSASEYAASEEAGKYTKANAIVINSFAVRIGSNFFIKIFKPKRPTKMFNSEEKAVEWLKSLLN